MVHHTLSGLSPLEPDKTSAPRQLPSALYVVSTPIGNPNDFTLRAINVIRDADVLVCEEFRNGMRLLKKLGIEPKEILTLNEHNESEQLDQCLLKIANGASLALVSDCGTPLFSDPGAQLVKVISDASFRVVPVPGVSSLMAALSVTPAQLKKFYFAGFLPRADRERNAELKRLNLLRVPVILMDTPYRMAAILKAVGATFGKNRLATLAMNLTQPDETILTGTVASIHAKVQNRKAEFILILHG